MIYKQGQKQGTCLLLIRKGKTEYKDIGEKAILAL